MFHSVKIPWLIQLLRLGRARYFRNYSGLAIIQDKSVYLMRLLQVVFLEAIIKSGSREVEQFCRFAFVILGAL